MVTATAVAEGQVDRGRSGCARRRRVGRAPRPRSRPGAKRGSLSSNGRPGTRQGVRTPHLRAAMPVDAYSLAVSCGGRGVSSDIWPASLVRHAPRRASPVLRARRGSLPVPRDASHHDPSAATPVFPALRVSAPCGFLAVGGAAPIRALPRIWRTVPCDASTAYAAALQPGTGSSPRVTPSGRALPSRQRRTWRPIDAPHSSTASPRRHQLSSYRNACRHWPGGDYCAPSLPELQPRMTSPPQLPSRISSIEVVTGRRLVACFAND